MLKNTDQGTVSNMALGAEFLNRLGLESKDRRTREKIMEKSP